MLTLALRRTTRAAGRSRNSRTHRAMTSVADVAALDPPAVFGPFSALTQIPRASKKEGQALMWITSFAEQRGLRYEQDGYGNLVVRKPGCGGGQRAPTVIVQGHVDMVTEKNANVAHDFTRDPLKLQLTDGWLRATGTTLGADNGVGVATALALLDLDPASAVHPPLEALFTVEEEIGLLGAAALDGTLLQGRTLLNLDSEDWGTVYIGCAGAGDCTIHIDITREGVAAEGLVACTLLVSGLQGGHSGLQIHEGLGNAVILLATTLRALLGRMPSARVVSMTGGDKRNAIPREASAKLLVPAQLMHDAHSAVAACLEGAQAEFGAVEPSLSITLGVDALGAVGTDAVAMSSADAARILDLLIVLPNGAVKFSHALPGLVETSNNLASIKPVDGSGAVPVRYAIVTSTRSSLPHALEANRDRIEAAARALGAECTRGVAYSGWAPNPDSQALQLAKAAIASVTGKEPEVTAIHAGLECGILQDRIPGCDMVSYGPTILGAHSPDERLDVSTVAPYWQATLNLMKALARVPA